MTRALSLPTGPRGSPAARASLNTLACKVTASGTTMLGRAGP